MRPPSDGDFAFDLLTTEEIKRKSNLLPILPLGLKVIINDNYDDFTTLAATTIISEADYILGKVSKNRPVGCYPGYSMLSKMGHNYARGLWVEINGLYGFYIQLSAISFTTKFIVSYLGAIFVGNYRQLCQTEIDWYSKQINVSDIVINNYFNEINKNIIFKKEIFVREKITQEHHTYIRPEEAILGSLLSSQEATRVKQGDIISIDKNSGCKLSTVVLHKLLTIDSVTEAMAATFLLYLNMVKSPLVKIFVKIILESNNLKDLVEKLKYEGRVAKQLQHFLRDDLNVIFELNVLVNRILDPVDWGKEANNRVDPKTYDVDPSAVYDISTRIFKTALLEGKVPRAAKWDDYWAQRWANMPTGSFVMSTDKFKEERLLFDNTARNKTTVLSAVKECKLNDLLNLQPGIFASTSTKYEWGKTRAIYGCDIESFLITDYAMRDAEDCLPSYFPVGKQATDDNVKRKIKQLASAIPLCYDYDDFNSQHSAGSMAMVIKAWMDVYAPYLSTDQLLSCHWVVKSVFNQTFRVNETNQEYRAKGTLFSGWRLTSLINTVLNRVYLETAGLTSLTLHSIHNGDDVLAAVEYFQQGVKLVNNAKNLGIRAQSTKMNYGTIGEFLRIDGLAKNPSSTQYITRACATSVHGRIESKEPRELEALLEATYERMTTLVTRGGDKDVIASISMRMFDTYANIFDTHKDVIHQYFLLHPIQGGRNKDALLQEKRLMKVQVSLDEEKAEKMANYMEYGAQDYINYLCGLYKIDKRKVDRMKIKSDNKKLLGIVKTTLKLVVEERKYIIAMRAIYKGWRTTTTTSNIAKARLLGLYNVSFTDKISKLLLNYIRDDDDPISLLNLMV